MTIYKPSIISPDQFIGVIHPKHQHISIIRRDELSKKHNQYYIKCLHCEQDPELYNDGIFKTRLSRFLSGVVSCGCGNAFKYSPEQYIIKINRILSKEKYKFIKFVNNYIILQCPTHGEWGTTRLSKFFEGSRCIKCGIENKRKTHEHFISEMILINKNIKIIDKYNGDSKHVKYLCTICDQIHKATPSNLLRGYGCPKCAVYGFNKEKCGYFYICTLYNNDIQFTGYGITKDIKRRFMEHNKFAQIKGFTIKNINTFYCENGKKLSEIENFIKINFTKNVYNVKGFIEENAKNEDYDAIQNYVISNIAS